MFQIVEEQLITKIDALIVKPKCLTHQKASQKDQEIKRKIEALIEESKTEIDLKLEFANILKTMISRKLKKSNGHKKQY